MEIDINDLKHSGAGIVSVSSWIFAHSNEIGFVIATSVSLLTVVYLFQGIKLRNRELKKDSV